jgi:hypothetical protein
MEFLVYMAFAFYALHVVKVIALAWMETNR